MAKSLKPLCTYPYARLRLQVRPPKGTANLCLLYSLKLTFLGDTTNTLNSKGKGTNALTTSKWMENV